MDEKEAWLILRTKFRWAGSQGYVDGLKVSEMFASGGRSITELMDDIGEPQEQIEEILRAALIV